MVDFRIIVNLRINETLQIGAVGNSAYQTWGAQVSIYFLNSLYLDTPNAQPTP